MDDTALTRIALAAGGGDQTAVEEFVRLTRADVWRFVAHLDGVQSADDLTQETYVRALRSLPGFAARSSARAWLLSIARRTVADGHRSSARRPRTGAVADPAARERPCCPRATGFDEGVALSDLLDRVEPSRREAFVLTQIAGMSYAEAAGFVGCPVGTIRSRVARARADMVGALRSAEAAAAPGGAVL